MNLTFDMIVAVAKNGVIGHKGKMPWHIPEDLQHFKRVTMGHPVIMGRKTWDSLVYKPLKGRWNIVWTKNRSWHEDGAMVFTQIEDMIAHFKHNVREDTTAFVIGGSDLYRLFLPWARYIWITRIESAPDGDTYFDLPVEKHFTLVDKHPPCLSVSGLEYTIEKWYRKGEA